MMGPMHGLPFEMAGAAPLPGAPRAVPVPVPVDLPQQVAAALSEDIRGGDLTAALIPPEKSGRATVITREAAILCGVPYVEATFKQVDARVNFDWHAAEGDAISVNQVLFSVDGAVRRNSHQGKSHRGGRRNCTGGRRGETHRGQSAGGGRGRGPDATAGGDRCRRRYRDVG